MKIKIALFLIVTASLYPEWIEPIMTVEMGYMLGDGYTVAIQDAYPMVLFDVTPKGTIDLDITVGAELFKYLWLEGQFITYMTLIDLNPMNGMFSPFQMEYGFRAGLQLKGLRLGYEHWCYHPIEVYGDRTVKRFGGIDRVFLQYNIQKD